MALGQCIHKLGGSPETSTEGSCPALHSAWLPCPLVLTRRRCHVPAIYAAVRPRHSVARRADRSSLVLSRSSAVGKKTTRRDLFPRHRMTKSCRVRRPIGLGSCNGIAGTGPFPSHPTLWHTAARPHRHALPRRRPHHLQRIGGYGNDAADLLDDVRSTIGENSRTLHFRMHGFEEA